MHDLWFSQLRINLDAASSFQQQSKNITHQILRVYLDVITNSTL